MPLEPHRVHGLHGRRRASRRRPRGIETAPSRRASLADRFGGESPSAEPPAPVSAPALHLAFDAANRGSNRRNASTVDPFRGVTDIEEGCYRAGSEAGALRRAGTVGVRPAERHARVEHGVHARARRRRVNGTSVACVLYIYTFTSRSKSTERVEVSFAMDGFPSPGFPSPGSRPRVPDPRPDPRPRPQSQPRRFASPPYSRGRPAPRATTDAVHRPCRTLASRPRAPWVGKNRYPFPIRSPGRATRRWRRLAESRGG